jgi:hypothetical protein
MTRLPARLATLLLVACCVALVPSTSHAQKRERDRVTRDEILSSGQGEQDLYTALRSLRPRFVEPPRGIRTLGNAMPVPIIVVVDGKRLGGLETLQSIVANTVDEVRYLEPSRSANEFGEMGANGAVVVKLWREPAKPRVKADSTPPKPDPMSS